MTFTGRCACGAVTLRIDADPLGTAQCWCRQCQTVAAGGATNNAIFLAEALQITGTPGAFCGQAESGNTVTRHFCTACGTPLFGQNSAIAHLVSVLFGVFDQPHDLKPEKVIWAQSAPAWAMLDPSLEHMAQQTPGEVQ